MTEQEEEEARLKKAREGGVFTLPKPQAVPPAASAPPPVKFTKPFTEDEKKKQADALVKKLRKTGDY